jgi:hypothetical protein
MNVLTEQANFCWNTSSGRNWLVSTKHVGGAKPPLCAKKQRATLSECAGG